MGLACVRLEIKRVQSFLFQEPYLAPMVGANVLIGEFLRVELPALHRQFVGPSELSGVTFPKVPRPKVSGDPLSQSDDDPNESYARGILVKDAGRFMALLEEDRISAFIAEAEASNSGRLLKDYLSWRVICLDESSKEFGQSLRPQSRNLGLGVRLPSSLPFLAHDAQGAALIFDRHHEPVVDLRRTKRNRFMAGGAQDMASLLVARIDARPAPSNLESLVDGDYLAVIQIDGNGIGARVAQWSETKVALPDTIAGWLQHQARLETFFWAMRRIMRAATVSACQSVFGASLNAGDSLSKAPYQLLMLGGDDLLLVCRAKQALDFVVAFEKSLSGASRELQIESADLPPPINARSPLSVSVGVVMSRHSVPFSQLQLVASRLCASAKVAARSAPNLDRSIVDWAVVTQSWIDDPIEARLKSDLVQSADVTYVLSRRPYRIASSATELGLDHLLDSARQLSRLLPDATVDERSARVARSQLKGLREGLACGGSLADLHWLDTPRPLREALSKLGCGMSVESPWSPVGDRSESPQHQATHLMDLVEIMEIDRLGHVPLPTGRAPAPASAADCEAGGP